MYLRGRRRRGAGGAWLSPEMWEGSAYRIGDDSESDFASAPAPRRLPAGSTSVLGKEGLDSILFHLY
jgi:hypothetical protein